MDKLPKVTLWEIFVYSARVTREVLLEVSRHHFIRSSVLFIICLAVGYPVLVGAKGEAWAMIEWDVNLWTVIALVSGAIVVVLTIASIVVPVRIDKQLRGFSPERRKNFLYNTLRWISDRANDIAENDPISIIVLKDHTVKLITEAFGRSLGDQTRTQFEGSPLNQIGFEQQLWGKICRKALVSLADTLGDTLDERTIQPSFRVDDWEAFDRNVEQQTLQIIMLRGRSIKGGRTAKKDDSDYGYQDKLKRVKWWLPVLTAHVQRTTPERTGELKRIVEAKDPSRCSSEEELEDLLTTVMSKVRALGLCN